MIGKNDFSTIIRQTMSVANLETLPLSLFNSSIRPSQPYFNCKHLKSLFSLLVLILDFHIIKQQQIFKIYMSRTTSVNGNRSKVKIVMLGDQGVGKTSIIEKFVHNKFQQIGYSTVGIDFLAKDYCYKNERVRLQLWDTAGQQRFRSLIPSYLRDSNCCIIVFDLTRKSSLQNVESWLSMYRQNRSQSPVAILAGNKSDDPNRVCQFDEVDKKAKQLGIRYVQVSAKLGSNLDLLFETCLNQIRVLANSNKFQQNVMEYPSLTSKPLQRMSSQQQLFTFPVKIGDAAPAEKKHDGCKC